VVDKIDIKAAGFWLTSYLVSLMIDDSRVAWLPVAPTAALPHHLQSFLLTSHLKKRSREDQEASKIRLVDPSSCSCGAFLGVINRQSIGQNTPAKST
jgi:hypothetical protein